MAGWLAGVACHHMVQNGIELIFIDHSESIYFFSLDMADDKNLKAIKIINREGGRQANANQIQGAGKARGRGGGEGKLMDEAK